MWPVLREAGSANPQGPPEWRNIEQEGRFPTEWLSAGELTVQLGSQVSQLLRDELALARAELFARARQAILGGGMLNAAALLGLTAGLRWWPR